MKVIFPPRPKGKMLAKNLDSYEKRGWICQRKFNGIRTLVYIKGNNVALFNRHGEPQKQLKLTPLLKKELLSLNLDPLLEYWFDGESFNSKSTNPYFKDKIVLFDVLQAGKYFFGGPSLTERHKILQDICRNPVSLEDKGIALRVTENIWLAENFDVDFTKRFNDFLELDEIEGLVVKKANSVLDNIGNKEYEVAWQIRCRKPHKNYNF